MRGEMDESIVHVIAECKKLAQKEYKQRHDNIARIVHLELCQKNLSCWAKSNGTTTDLKV